MSAKTFVVTIAVNLAAMIAVQVLVRHVPALRRLVGQ